MKKINENTKVTLTLKQLKRLVKESDGEKDSKGMMMWNSNDEEISVEEFVDKVHRVEQDLEDMIIQNAEVYANADDPWMLFCDDITDEDHDTEEALGLDFYAYSTAKDKLPKDISKYICFPSSGKGSGFFDAVEFTHDIFTRVMSVCKDLDESVHEARLNWKGPKVLKHKWDGYTGMVTFRLGKISDEEYYRNPARRCPVDITIETNMGHFSATAMIGNANDTGFNHAGQIIDLIADHHGYVYKQLPRLSQVMVDKIAGWWKQYHLVDLDDIPEEDYDAISQMIEYAKDYEVTEGVLKESDEVKLQMVALKKAYDQIKAGKRKAEAGNWKIEALGKWNDDLGLLEHGAHWVYFKDAAILEVNFETREYAYLMETAILSKEMVDAMLDVLECKDFHLEGDGLPDFLADDEA